MSEQIQSVLKEGRLFPPPESFSHAAHIGSAAELDQPGNGLVFVVPVTKVLGIPHITG